MNEGETMERILICGDRNWNNFPAIIETLSEVQQTHGIETVIEGEATGADCMGREAAVRLGCRPRGCNADARELSHGRSSPRLVGAPGRSAGRVTPAGRLRVRTINAVLRFLNEHKGKR